MAETNTLKEVLNVFITCVSSHLRCHLCAITARYFKQGTIFIVSDQTKFFEDKLVLCESTCFVTENVTYIRQFLMQIHIIDSEFIDLFKLCVYLTHLDIVLHEHGGKEFSDFNDNRELKWYEAIKDQVETKEA